MIFEDVRLDYALDSGYLDDECLERFKSQVPIECCAKCRFWNEDEPPTWDGAVSESTGVPIAVYTGECRRHAPVVVQFETEVGLDYPNYRVHPSTRYDHWCGDFEPLG